MQQLKRLEDEADLLAAQPGKAGFVQLIGGYAIQPHMADGGKVQSASQSEAASICRIRCGPSQATNSPARDFERNIVECSYSFAGVGVILAHMVERKQWLVHWAQ